MDLGGYQLDGFYDEMFRPDGTLRPAYEGFSSAISGWSREELLRRKRMAERSLLNRGITFQVYGDASRKEQIFPFDAIPRIIEAKEWKQMEKGLKQRTFALNEFINDIYHDKKIVKDGVIPTWLLASAKSYLPVCEGLNPPRGIWCHINGVDLVRSGDGRYYVLEDNLRCPSGVSYVLVNRENMKRTFPEIFLKQGVLPVYDYPYKLKKMLSYISGKEDPVLGVLTPGQYNSAYFEHGFLAQQMGAELVEGSDLIVYQHEVYMKTTRGLKRVDAVYRRIDDTFMDPLAFRPDSMLGVPGIFEAYRRGNFAMANAPGTGIADDKAVYAYVPRMIKYYTGEDPILPNVPTFVCADDKEKRHVIQNLENLVVKAANEAGGYGMLIGPRASKQEIEEFRVRIHENPRNYIAQPVLDLSRVPVITDQGIEGRHVDLRPYIIYGEDIFVLPGGLTRVALKKGSLVVNSSQGGGSKDTWVLPDPPC
ncbi:MAG TPA: circularly permuted type 2 ATP-grasp protein [Leptospiraceae bacterium]|nr:circularly permuted type 2 ATP-grasp protein [Leptospiraceae bacterium]HMW60010.1 circularly permuted type 2 ATP-grasp protein [Leptospiraceae bacterium]HMX55241.1 circularly permuted type 2 ATP-grasp protein [Leptospiraceae bacterium]HMY43980.1 circularly permuted type 2 ATP-grasp protein [Leptospiraceae bacterium]HMZ35778.1 circularly permuted type 2 ATP-grasp protein [Leptospiraceae bacterium]